MKDTPFIIIILLVGISSYLAGNYLAIENIEEKSQTENCFFGVRGSNMMGLEVPVNKSAFLSQPACTILEARCSDTDMTGLKCSWDNRSRTCLCRTEAVK